MKSSLNINLDSHRSHYVLGRKRNQKGIWFVLLFSLALAIYFFIPQVIESAPIVDFKPSPEQISKVIPLPNLEELRIAQHHAKSDQEVRNLLNQEYLDPLTRYIEKYRLDQTRARYIQKVKTERDRRCNEIEQRYQKMNKDSVTLARLKQGYEYSCPQVVVKFMRTLK